jgi:haloalkane dehalogenase
VAVSVRSTSVLGLTMAYREGGLGDPIVLLHGNPTSSYLWRHVMPDLEPLGRCLAPDLIGMGDSQKVPAAGPRSYRFVEHRRYLDALLEQLGVTDRVTLVGHDWGAVLGVDWARRHPQAVRGIAYLETLVAPVRSDSANAPDPAFFAPLRTPRGESLVLQDNAFIEQILPAGTQRPLRQEEMDAYRRPFRDAGEGRRPMLTWAREIPLDGEPPDVHDVVSRNAAWMATTPVPKLFINAEPGALLTGELREQCRRWPQQREVTVPGTHFLPEDSPQDIASALRDWIPTLP